METDSTNHASEPPLRQLGGRVTESAIGRNGVHVSVRCDRSDVTAAAIEFVEQLFDQLSVLATVPDRDAIVEGDFGDRYDVLAAADVPSPVVAARLMRIDVGKELEPASTVTVETETGGSIEARSWTVEIVDDGSSPGWDEPTRMMAANADAASDSGTEPVGPDPAEEDSGPDDDPGADVETVQDEGAGRQDSSEDPGDRPIRGEEPERHPVDDGERGPAATPASPSPSDAHDEHVRRPLDSELDLDPILEDLDSTDDPEDRRAILRGAIEGDAPESVRVRLQHLEAELNSLAAYATVLERFVDEHGTPRRAFEEVTGEIERIGRELDELESQVETNAERVPAIANSVARLDRHLEERSQDLAQRLDDHSELLENRTARIGALETAVDKLLALQREQWVALGERVDDLESRTEERLSDLDERIEEGDRELRRTLAGWITDAELERHELEQRVAANENWRRSVSDLSMQEPRPP